MAAPIAVPVRPVTGAQDEDGFDQSPDSGNDRSDKDDPSDQGQQQLSHGLAGVSQIEVMHAEATEEQAEQAGDDNTQGTITGIKAGKADVTAEEAGVSSEKAEVKVIALPVDLELNASNTVKENSVVYDEGGDLVVFISPTSGYGQIMLTLTDAYKGGGYAGHYDIPVGTVVDIDGARAEVMGSMDISGSGDETTVSFSITGNVGSRTLSIEADSVPVVL